MTIKSINSAYFDKEGHLNLENKALYSEALVFDKVEKLPHAVRQHVEECIECKKDIIELFEILRKEKTITKGHHPYLIEKKVYSRQLLRIAALFAGLIGLTFVIYYLFTLQQNYEDLFAQNFEPYIDIITERGDMKTNEGLNKVISEYYNKKEYNTANTLFSKLYQSDKSNDSIAFYYANSSLAVGDYNKAIELFKMIIEDSKSIFYEQSMWYLALSYLKGSASNEGKKQSEMLFNTKKTLNKVIEIKSPYQSRARDLIKELPPDK